MKKFERNSKKWQFAVIIMIAVAVIVGVYYRYTTIDNNSEGTNSSGTVSTKVTWTQTDSGWKPSAKPPECPQQPMLISPVDTNLVTAILYPGQERGGDFKPHGGFRFDRTDGNNVVVKAPLDAVITVGSSYLEGGEIQYLFEFMNSCGIAYRFDHLRVLSDKLQKIADTWPKPTEGDSRTHTVDGKITVKQGEILASKIGFLVTSNASVDFGVYDYRQENEASKSSEFRKEQESEKSQAYFAVCWFDWLPSQDAVIVKSLPAGDGKNGKTSAYCL